MIKLTITVILRSLPPSYQKLPRAKRAWPPASKIGPNEKSITVKSLVNSLNNMIQQ